MEPIKPTIYEQLRDITVKEGDKVRLDCVIVAQPEPEVTFNLLVNKKCFIYNPSVIINMFSWLKLQFFILHQTNLHRLRVSAQNETS